MDEFVLLRSSADPDGARVILHRKEWQEFITGVKGGDFHRL
jgi:Domain of unknown function (DUF397)